MLFNFVGPQALANSNEEQLLTHINLLPLKQSTKKVQENESITRFISRLKCQAMLCNFVRACDCTSHGWKNFIFGGYAHVSDNSWPKGSFNNYLTQNCKILTYLLTFVTLFYNKISFHKLERNAGNLTYLP